MKSFLWGFIALSLPLVLLETVIPFTVKLPDSSVAGDSILKTNPESPATEAYRKLAKEIERRG